MPPRDLSRRKFFMHPAHPAIGVSSGLAALQACQPAPGVGVARQSPGPLRVCLLADATPPRSDCALAALKAALKECLAGDTLHCTAALLTADDHVCGLDETLDRCDCLLLAGPLPLAAGPLERIDRFCRGGGAIVGLRSLGGDAARCGLFARNIFGVDCEDCCEPSAVQIVRAAGCDHPVLDGVGDFAAEMPLGRRCRLAADATLLLSANAANGPQPVAWVRRHHAARIFATALGREDHFHLTAFQRLLRNAVVWATRRTA